MDEAALRRGLVALAKRMEVEQPPLRPILVRGRRKRAVWLAGISLTVCVIAAGVAWPLARLSPLNTGHLPNVMESPPSDISQIGGPGVTLVDVGGVPGPMAVGEGGVWILRQRKGQIQQVVEIDPMTNDLAGAPVDVSIEHGAEIVDLAAGENGVWVLVLRLGPARNWDVPGTVLRIDPVSRTVVARIQVGRHPLGIAAGLGGVWVSNTTDGTVSRIDPQSNAVATTILVGKGPDEITTGAGSVWVGNSFGRPNVMRLDPLTNDVVATFHDVGAPVAADGYVWVGGPGKPNGVIERIDSATNRVIGPVYGVDIGPAFAVAGHGMAWIAKWFYNPARTKPPGQFGGIGPPYVMFRMFRVNPRTLRPVGFPVTVGFGPTQPIEGFGAAWIPSSGLGPHVVVRVDPEAGMPRN